MGFLTVTFSRKLRKSILERNASHSYIYVVTKAASARFELATPGLGNLCSIP